MVLCLHATHWDVVALRRRARRSITDLFCTVIQLDLVGNSVVFIIAHGFLLSITDLCEQGIVGNSLVFFIMQLYLARTTGATVTSNIDMGY